MKSPSEVCVKYAVHDGPARVSVSLGQAGCIVLHANLENLKLSPKAATALANMLTRAVEKHNGMQD